MSHQKIQDQLLLLGDKELPEAERAEINAHLASCHECQNTLKSWETVRQAMETQAPAPNSEWFVNRVMSRVAALEETALTGSKSWLSDWLAPVFGYTVAIFLMFLAISHQEPIVNAETILLSEVPESSSWVFSDEPPEIYNLLNNPQEDI